ncbi:TonB-dependent receptor [Flavihumibacter sp. CACIAM 22H1]|uniref:TonB-dependent receptor n=1 Tax=Flavihumibacter sp. CACIAM 22H1 TaxID=1812911 RepID=UPI0007A7CD9D|nr:TonB-dependent receptor [Flavihumibacter sp. CACIAM 22H1]KYP16575.1 MAG: hypothetical protein A1D16_09145 [Flavihumibacter sp. CACIAM 22H1]
MKQVGLLLLISLISSLVLAQPSNDYALLKGVVDDARNQSKLGGASIRIKGSSEGAIADLNGAFALYTRPGAIALEISYLGYRDTVLELSLEAGTVHNLRVHLSSNTPELNSVVIAGYLQGQAKALNQQKNADNIKNIISSDQIGRFPDPNAAEALQRVPGVNIERDQGEGRYVLVRGLAPQFTNININGEQIPSPEADVRFVALDAIPSDQLASIEVSKTLSPDMDGDAVGGSVNLITRMAQSKQPRISGSLAGGYNALMKLPNWQGQLQYEQRFGKKEKLGLLLNGNYYLNQLGSDNWEQAPNDNELELRDYELTRTRSGLSGTVDYHFNNRHEVYVRGIYSRFTDREWRRRYVFVTEEEEIEKLTKDRFESQSIMAINLGGKHRFNGFYLNYEAQYSRGIQHTPYDHELGFVAELPSSYSIPDGKFPRLNANEYTNSSLYEFDEVAYGGSYAKDQNTTGKFEIGIPYKTGRSGGTLKFGAKARFKQKSYTITNDIYAADAGIPTADAFDEAPIKARFLKGRFDMGRPLNLSSFNRFFNANPGFFELDVESKSIDEALESFDARENVYAGFVMSRHQFKKLLLTGGFRWEHTEVSYQSKDVLIDAAGDLEAIRPVDGRSSYSFLLPQVQARYELSKFTNLRASVARSYARPNFGEIIPAQEINREDRVANLGNPSLKPTNALNLDLLLEHYFGNVGIAAAGIFYKKLDDFIYRRVRFNSSYPLTGTPIVPRIDVIQAQNGNVANLVGLEFSFQRKLDFLPGFLKKLSVYANYTYTHSKATIQSRTADETKPDEKEKFRLPGQATHVGNLALAYENKKLVLRLAANFNGEYLTEVGGNANEDLYIKSRLQLDFSSSYAFSQRFRFFAEALNLTNQPFESFYGSKSVMAQREFYRSWARLGVKFDLSSGK